MVCNSSPEEGTQHGHFAHAFPGTIHTAQFSLCSLEMVQESQSSGEPSHAGSERAAHAGLLQPLGYSSSVPVTVPIGFDSLSLAALFPVLLVI